MKPIIVDMKDMSDSTEVYESKPNRFLIYTIYLIFIILVSIVLWMALSKIDIVVKSDGMFKGSNAVYEISSGITGSVTETHIENGEYVKEGEVLYVLSIEQLSDTILRYQNDLEDAKSRIEVLSAYDKSLDGDKTILTKLSDNPYYEEFQNRRELLYANINLNTSDTAGQTTVYQGNVDSISETIALYEQKILNLSQVKRCITERDNSFDSGMDIYYSMVNSYLESYNYTALQYENKANEYQRQIEEYNKQIKYAETGVSKAVENKTEITMDHTLAKPIEEVATGTEETDSIGLTEEGNSENTTESETVEDNTVPDEKDITEEPSENLSIDVEALKEQRDTLIATQNSINKEKEQALTNLELQQLATIEQQISGYNETILSLKTNRTSAQLQLDALNSVDNEVKKSATILTEKGNVANEILSYKDKLKECENYLKSYDIQNDNCIIKANMSGYFYLSQELKTGSFVQEGTTIGMVYPETESKYYAEIYVENSDIAKIKEGQEVKFEISAYPSSEYGYFQGTVENIAKDISVDQSTGYAYYLVKVKCDNMTLIGKDGKEATLMNGMACQGKIVVDEKNVLTYLLEKIDLLD